ncbi:nuclear transport factor 2 family protein [Pseudomonas sp. M47T1]|uniref:nuclear transport factor 2 family protein n=1 Tax=Pseudomonas sp. M47T1 TaxID=1179778 RepID=UPI0005B97525|nr:nuclear transport factor 2 family protein [Pseudomonas sp. M47T1]
MSNSAATSESTSITEQVFRHHLGAFALGIDELLKDYTDGSVIITPTATHAGLNQIRAFFEAFLASTTPEFWAAFQVESQAVKDEVAYLTWSAAPFIPMATDTLVIRGARIAIQTFTPFQ